MGGQTGAEHRAGAGRMGVLDRYGVELIGAKRAAIEMAEDRKLFREAMDRIGLESPQGHHRRRAEARRERSLRHPPAWLSHAMAIGDAALEIVGLPASSAPPSRLAAPAAASPTTATIREIVESRP
jgi:carbamoyl-phosphate synthase large subunit